MMIYLANQRYLRDVPVNRITEFEGKFYEFMENNYPEIGKVIYESKNIDDETKEKINDAVEVFKRDFLA
jgi:F-type H+-transporting ATPase subunit alpha